MAAALSGTFVVNGSPTQTQVADSAGGRSQLTQLTTSAAVLLVLLLLTGPLAYLPIAALAAIVFLIAAGLIDVAGMRRILACRRLEFAIALLTAAAVVVLGVEEGIVLAVVASVIDHVRHTYPLNSVLVKSPAGHWQPAPVLPGARTEEGLAVYRFGTRLYYANASRLIDDVIALAARGQSAAVDGSRLCGHRRRRLHCGGGRDPRYRTPPQTTHPLRHQQCSRAGVHEQLDRYGISAALGPGAYYDTPGEALEAFHTTERPSPRKPRTQDSRRAGHDPDSGVAHYIKRASPNMVTAVPVGIAGLTVFLLKSRPRPVLTDLDDPGRARKPGQQCDQRVVIPAQGAWADRILACCGPFRAISRAGTSHTASGTSHMFALSRTNARTDQPDLGHGCVSGAPLSTGEDGGGRTARASSAWLLLPTTGAVSEVAGVRVAYRCQVGAPSGPMYGGRGGCGSL